MINSDAALIGYDSIGELLQNRVIENWIRPNRSQAPGPASLDPRSGQVTCRRKC